MLEYSQKNRYNAGKEEEGEEEMKTPEKIIAFGLASGFLVLPEFNSSILIKHEKKSRKPREIAVFYLQSPRVNGIIY